MIRKTYIPAKPRNKKLIGTGGSGGISSSMSGAVANSHTHANKAVLDLFRLDENGNVYLNEGFYSKANVSAYGLGLPGSSGDGSLIIVDNLESTESNKALSAYQGKVLNDKIKNLTPDEDGIYNVNIEWGNIVDKPTAFTPTQHSHNITEVDGLQGALDSKASQSDIDTAIDGIKFGGRNLFYGGLESGRWNSSTGGKVSISSKLRCKQLISVEPNTHYIITNHSASDSYIYLLVYGVEGVFIKYVSAEIGQYRFTTDADTYYITFYVDINTGASINDLIKLEKGNKATDWTPAPEDVDAKITLVQSEHNVLKERYDELEAKFNKMFDLVNNETAIEAKKTIYSKGNLTAFKIE